MMNVKTQVADIKIGTDINSIFVPERLRVRQDLGIDWVNNALGGGGMTPSTVGMVTGSPGCGKSTMLRQLADGITGQGHIAIYNTGEESLFQAKMRCEDMGLTNGFQVGQETFVGKVLAHAREMQLMHPKRQVFILQDSLQTLDDGHYRNGTTSNTPVRCAQMLHDWSKETYGIVLFIGQVTKSGIFAGKNVIRHMVDVHLEVIRDSDPRSPTSGQLLFSVSKNRFGYTGRTYVVSLGKKGLSVLGDADELIHEEAEDEGDSPARRTVSGVRPKVEVPRTGTNG
jgi:DNA repair protein RadA/Sms